MRRNKLIAPHRMMRKAGSGSGCAGEWTLETTLFWRNSIGRLSFCVKDNPGALPRQVSVHQGSDAYPSKKLLHALQSGLPSGRIPMFMALGRRCGMDRIRQWDEELRKQHGMLKWIANVDKDDESVRVKGHIVGPPKADDQYSSEDLEEMGVVGIYTQTRKDKKKRINLSF
jgi:hypothetical protein